VVDVVHFFNKKNSETFTQKIKFRISKQREHRKCYRYIRLGGKVSTFLR